KNVGPVTGSRRDGLHELHTREQGACAPELWRAGHSRHRRCCTCRRGAGRMNEPVLTEITLEDIESLAVGAWILGTGGGGSPYLGLLNLRRLYAEGYRVQLMSPLDLEDDDRVAVVSNMGAPLVGQERLADSRNIARAVEMQEDYSGVKFRAVMSLEIGGGNGIQPLMAAAHLGLPVVDADLMGRAYP